MISYTNDMRYHQYAQMISYVWTYDIIFLWYRICYHNKWIYDIICLNVWYDDHHDIIKTIHDIILSISYTILYTIPTEIIVLTHDIISSSHDFMYVWTSLASAYKICSDFNSWFRWLLHARPLQPSYKIQWHFVAHFNSSSYMITRAFIQCHGLAD